MIIYKKTKKEFIDDMDQRIVGDFLREEIKFLMNRTTSDSEYRSWENSLSIMRTILDKPEIDDEIGVAIEYNLPRSNKRIDMVLSGINQEKERLLIIELKQWEKCEKVVEQDMIVRTYVAKNLREVTHPSYQAYAYGKFLDDFSEVVYSSENIEVQTCAFLHNYDVVKYPDIIDKQYEEYLHDSPLFFKTDYGKLREYIKDFIPRGDRAELISKIDEGQIRPSKSIQNYMRTIIDGKSDFMLLDDQKEVLEKALALSRKTKKDGKKRVLIIPGGPGTGKTLIALQLLSKAIQNDGNAIYCSKSEAVRNAFKKLILDGSKDKKYTKVTVDNLFYGTSKFSYLIKNQYDMTIVDEAHRVINRHQYTPKDRGYNNQIREIICESKFSVFFIDEKQIVTTKDIGTIEEIQRQARLEGVEDDRITVFDPLVSQFRSSGADDYINFVDYLLYDGEKSNLSFRNTFDFKIFDDVQEMYDAIVEKSKQNSARVLAGYCWNWISKKDKELLDIEIGNFKKQWNLENDKYFMLNNESINQIGSVHQVQGLEIDYAGVIIGPDLYSDGTDIKTDWTKRAKSDKSLINIKTETDNSLPLDVLEMKKDKIIRNTYNVLLTRAMKGCYIYCVDKNLSNLIKSKIFE
ncbi:hypothetical protein SCHIN_v1c07660 [Spiroplasma chinense]|uniref:Helicase ATP-binding domain-containing protein n=1 Tax=Spiroplasma chinense TaxID=216932 RepID=A0A5B9Y4J3_9MOLU|nr:DUF2075 domain-containing protein [Spiroplasma chinense]QEH61961.1 hypothetical protein SCHIN_v1c07660 [Spiroplasma chinense]